MSSAPRVAESTPYNYLKQIRTRMGKARIETYLVHALLWEPLTGSGWSLMLAVFVMFRMLGSSPCEGNIEMGELNSCNWIKYWYIT